MTGETAQPRPKPEIAPKEHKGHERRQNHGGRILAAKLLVRPSGANLHLSACQLQPARDTIWLRLLISARRPYATPLELWLFSRRTSRCGKGISIWRALNCSRMAWLTS